MTVAINDTMTGLVMFIDLKAQLITTPIATLTMRRGFSGKQYEYWAYYGLKGKSELTEKTFVDIHTALGLNVPATVADPNDANDGLTAQD